LTRRKRKERKKRKGMEIMKIIVAMTVKAIVLKVALSKITQLYNILVERKNGINTSCPASTPR